MDCISFCCRKLKTVKSLRDICADMIYTTAIEASYSCEETWEAALIRARIDIYKVERKSLANGNKYLYQKIIKNGLWTKNDTKLYKKLSLPMNMLILLYRVKEFKWNEKIHIKLYHEWQEHSLYLLGAYNHPFCRRQVTAPRDILKTTYICDNCVIQWKSGSWEQWQQSLAGIN
jgi:hypothetical protein